MKHFCTVSDKNYLSQGLALYSSLLKGGEAFKLHYFCIDSETFTKTSKYSNIIPYSSGLAEADERLLQLKKRDYKRYCWSLASWFTERISDIAGEVTYLDSDIFFHKSWHILFEEFGDKEVGIFRHRQFPYGNNRIEGYYNVGVVHFKNTANAKNVLSWWADAVINNKYPNLSTCGDQKYLDAFPLLCKAGSLFVDGNIGHGAPWQWQLYDYSIFKDNGKIIWDGREQDLVFSHFSQFKADFDSNTYIPSTKHHCYTPLEHYQISPLKDIYDNYFNWVKIHGQP